jgi:hypothetical protein
LNYTLVAGELAAAQQLLSIQAAMGAGAPPVTPSTMAAVIQQLSSLSAAYPNLKNSVFRGFVDQLYQSLITVPTVYSQPFPALYIAYWYRNDSPYKVDLENPWQTFCSGDSMFSAWSRPQYPAFWQSEINGLITGWGQSPPSNIIQTTGNRAIWAFEDAVLGAQWTDIAAITPGTAKVWAAQVSSANDILQPASLAADAYFFLLHLLIGLVTGDTSTAALAQRIVTALTNSTEYPNDKFINQLIYSSLMYLSDPAGAYGWDNQQLQSYVASLESLLTSGNPAAAAIKASLVSHGRILYSDASYPMVDPYNPATGFTQRQTDTLYALDQIRAILRQPRPVAIPIAGATTESGGTLMETTGTSTTLAAGDIGALGGLAKIQGDIGALPLTKAGLTDFMVQLNALSYTSYGTVANATAKGWLDSLYSGLMNQSTVYGQPVHALFIAYNYGLYVAGNYEAWYEISGQTFMNFMGMNASYGIAAWSPPAYSAAWKQAVVSLSQQWNSALPPGSIIASNPGMAYQYEIDFEANLFDPANWKDAGNVITGQAALWTAQRNQLSALIQQKTLALGDAVLTLYLLIAMVNSASSADRTLGAQIANLPTSSPELPNDTFANQLTYCWLMAMADPLGNFAFTYSQLASLLAVIAGSVSNQDPGSELLSKVFTQQSKILASDQSYPMQDPYNPSIGFTVRQTDTLAALNRSWATLAGASAQAGA